MDIGDPVPSRSKQKNHLHQLDLEANSSIAQETTRKRQYQQDSAIPMLNVRASPNEDGLSERCVWQRIRVVGA
jgi:hypothetical protein